MSLAIIEIFDLFRGSAKVKGDESEPQFVTDLECLLNKRQCIRQVCVFSVL